ncbi:MAG: hypothetical protein AAFW98_09160 [Pseudomonadota bacterium]
MPKKPELKAATPRPTSRVVIMPPKGPIARWRIEVDGWGWRDVADEAAAFAAALEAEGALIDAGFEVKLDVAADGEAVSR